MWNRRKSILLIAFTMGLLFTVFVLAQTVEAGGGKKNYGDCPVWKIFKNGTANSVKWIKHKPNKRFLIYKSGTPNDPYDDLVLDQETCLIWERAPEGRATWYRADWFCYEREMGGRYGSRLPTITELMSLFDPSQEPLALPKGHPFINIAEWFYFSSTTDNVHDNHDPGELAFVVLFYDDGSGARLTRSVKTNTSWVWCVRGGQGYDAPGFDYR